MQFLLFEGEWTQNANFCASPQIYTGDNFFGAKCSLALSLFFFFTLSGKGSILDGNSSSVVGSPFAIDYHTKG